MRTPDMIDLHTHVLPYLDDGARDWDETLRICRLIYENGVRIIGVTPHVIPGSYDNDREKILRSFHKLREKLKREEIDLEVIPGAEIYLFKGIIEELENKNILTINDMNKFILLELPGELVPSFTKDLIFQLQLEDITPILCHPERNHKIIKTPNLIYEFVRQGALVQISSHSVLGNFGKEVRRTAERLLRYNLVHLMGSDIHSSKRPSLLRESLEVISEWIGQEEALKLVTKNPQKIITGERWILEPEKVKEGRKSFIHTICSRFSEKLI